LAIAYFEHTAEEIQHVGVGLQAWHGNVLSEFVGGAAIQLGDAQVKAA
jgi:hypothetical protein